MNEETKLMWRKTTDAFALMDWSGVKRKDGLPQEYVNGKGPKFWHVPATVIGDTRYNEYIQLGEDVGKALGVTSTFPSRIYIGTVLLYGEHALVEEYLFEASQRLHDLNAQIADSEMVTTLL